MELFDAGPRCMGWRHRYPAPRLSMNTAIAETLDKGGGSMRSERNLLLNEQKIEKVWQVHRVIHQPVPYTRNPLIFGHEFCDREKLAEVEAGKPEHGGQG